MSSSEDIKPQITLDPPKPSVAENDDERLALAENLKGAMVWAVKVPRFLLERWERVPEAGIELGTLVVDNSYASGVAPPSLCLVAGAWFREGVMSLTREQRRSS
jgi:hypothetical protein